MKEDLLQYIWKFQLFNRSELECTNGDKITIIQPGNHNTNQGPDFLQGKIKIGNTTWVGNIEIHINSSHWNQHEHSNDPNYQNVILHVVWNHDIDIKDKSGSNLPTIELQSRVSNILMEKYRLLMQNPVFIPCEDQVECVDNLIIENWKQRLAAERLINKSERVLAVFNDTGLHWEETFWQLIAANFGLKINSDFFHSIAQSLPLSILYKHRHNIIQVESLLMGQAGLLNQILIDKYASMLVKEYAFYQKKYSLEPIKGQLSFLRMRPANFPTIRLAQLSMLLVKSEHLFSVIKETESVEEVRKLLKVSANDYWHYHYVFDAESGYKIKELGKQMIDNIVINTIIPILFAYGLYHNEEKFKEKAIDWLQQISPEKNTITKGFENIGFENKNALDSQAFLHLKKEYCDEKRCLECAIGNSILKKEL
jgi:hypothetical protein